MSQNPLRVCAVQAVLAWEDPAANRFHIGRALAAAPAADLVLLPEMFNTGFSMRAAQIAEPMDGPTLQWMQALAAEREALVCGSLAIAEGGHFYNRFIAVSGRGVEAHYDKRHLFHPAGEDAAYRAGARRVVFEWRGWRICPQICYDLRFPVWSRTQVSEAGPDYDLLLFLANWPEMRIAHWDTLLRARAIENQAFVAAVNRVGRDGNGHPYNGHSVLLDMRGECLAELPENEEGLLFAEFDAAALADWRQRFAVWKDADAFRLG